MHNSNCWRTTIDSSSNFVLRLFDMFLLLAVMNGELRRTLRSFFLLMQIQTLTFQFGRKGASLNFFLGFLVCLNLLFLFYSIFLFIKSVKYGWYIFGRTRWDLRTNRSKCSRRSIMNRHFVCIPVNIHFIANIYIIMNPYL
jgi:hypothetical protein